MRISDWSSGVCSSDLVRVQRADLGLAYFRLVENQAFGMREGIRVARPRGRLAWRGAHRFSCRAFGLRALARRRTALGCDVRPAIRCGDVHGPIVRTTPLEARVTQGPVGRSCQELYLNQPF